MKNDSKFLFENRFKTFVWKSYDVIIVDEDYVRNTSLSENMLYVIAEDSKVVMLSSGIIYWVGDLVIDKDLYPEVTYENSPKKVTFKIE